MLTVVCPGPDVMARSGRVMTFICRCDCGVTKNVRLSNLVSKEPTRSCGCIRGKTRESHGLRSTDEYNIWSTMKQRCENPRGKNYPYYGARGITVDPEWNSFTNFYRDMGPRPDKSLTLERVDNNKGYTKSNCVWATRLAQSHNRRNSANNPKGGSHGNS